MRRVTLALLVTMAIPVFTGSVRADDYAAHRILDVLTDVKILKRGQSRSIYDLQREELHAIAEIKKLVKTNKRALKARNAVDQTLVMRASEAGFFRLLNALLRLAPHTGDLRATDIRGLTVADHATLSGMRSYTVCNPRYDVGKSDIKIRNSYTAMTQAYETILTGLMRHRVPTNPRRVAQVWLRACPGAAPDVKREMKRLSGQNSSLKIQNYLLLKAEGSDSATRIKRKRRKIQRIHKSQISTSGGGRPELKSALAKAKKISVGPLTVAKKPNGHGVVIATIPGGKKSPIDGTIDGGGSFSAAIGQRVVSIGGIHIEKLKDVEHALSQLRQKKRKRADIKVLYRFAGSIYGVLLLKNIPIGR